VEKSAKRIELTYDVTEKSPKYSLFPQSSIIINHLYDRDPLGTQVHNSRRMWVISPYNMKGPLNLYLSSIMLTLLKTVETIPSLHLTRSLPDSSTSHSASFGFSYSPIVPSESSLSTPFCSSPLLSSIYRNAKRLPDSSGFVSFSPSRAGNSFDIVFIS
jgi:hypothetical protein